jgi:hypothetical protein
MGADFDDRQSLIRLLLYTNEIDIEGLIATTSTFLRDQARRTGERVSVDPRDSGNN